MTEKSSENRSRCVLSATDQNESGNSNAGSNDYAEPTSVSMQRQDDGDAVVGNRKAGACQETSGCTTSGTSSSSHNNRKRGLRRTLQERQASKQKFGINISNKISPINSPTTNRIDSTSTHSAASSRASSSTTSKASDRRGLRRSAEESQAKREAIRNGRTTIPVVMASSCTAGNGRTTNDIPCEPLSRIGLRRTVQERQAKHDGIGHRAILVHSTATALPKGKEEEKTYSNVKPSFIQYLEEEEEEDDDGNQTRQTTTPRQPTRASVVEARIPGAYAEGQGVDPQRREHVHYCGAGNPASQRSNRNQNLPSDTDEDWQAKSGSMMMNSSQQGDDEELGLARAVPIDNDDDNDKTVRNENLMFAQEIDPEITQKKELQKKERRKCRMVGYLLIALSCIVMAISFSAQYNTTTTISSSPRSVSQDRMTTPPSLAQPSSQSPSSSSPTHQSLDLSMMDLPEDTLQNLQSIATPQWKGYDWLSRHPHLASMEEWRKLQLFVLATFFFSMEGPHWPDNIQNNWMLYGVNECFWFSNLQGVFLPNQFGGTTKQFWQSSSSSYRDTQECDERGRYQSLSLIQLNLTSYHPSIPPEIELLTSLTKLSLGGNNIRSNFSALVPSQLYKMNTLTSLELYQNELTGPIPTQLGMLSSTRKLHLFANRLTGQLPTQLGMMTNLETLDVNSNLLTSTLPTQLGRLSKLELLGFHLNGLMSGTIPTQVGKLSSSLAFLFLSDSSLSGEIPTQIGLLSSLDSLFLHGNQLSGQLPSQLGLLQCPQSDTGFFSASLWLHNNDFSGSLPSQFGMLSSIQSLTISNNLLLSGQIPSQMGWMSSIQVLDLSSLPLLTGQVPTQLWELPNLGYLNFSQSYNLSGTIPDSFCRQVRNRNNESCAYLGGGSYHGDDCSLDISCGGGGDGICGCGCDCSS